MKTIEELEAELETVTRERDLSLFAWESAGMQGRTAQSAMLELARQLEEARAIVGSCWLTYSEGERDKARAWAHKCERERDEARETILALTTAKAEADLEIAILTAALDERDLEAERSLEQYDSLVRERDEARAEVERLTREPAVHPSNLTDVVSLLEDERDELLVRVANQDAELRATREAYRDAFRRGAEAMRDECIGAACGFFMGTQGFCNGDEDELEAVLEALPIPEEP
jgi:chromosome segregation ATPase